MNVTYAAEGAPRALLVLAHGAGAGQKHPFMVNVARGLASRGIDVVTFDFPYMVQGRKAPDRAPVLEQAFRDAIASARQWSTKERRQVGPPERADKPALVSSRRRATRHPADSAARLFIGGKSMGGRLATHLGAQGLDGLEGIVALGYPLHPPARPQQLRTAHLPGITAPVLIVQGERDTFGTPAELEPVIRTMKAPVTLHVVAGADHSLTVKRKDGAGAFGAILDRISGWIGE